MSLHKLARYLSDLPKLVALKQALYKKQHSPEQNSPSKTCLGRCWRTCCTVGMGSQAALERQLSSAMADWQSQERRRIDLTESLTTLSRLRKRAEDQASTAIKKAKAAALNRANPPRPHNCPEGA